MTSVENAGWEELRQRVASCQGCELCRTRTNTVFGQGSTRTSLVFVGEGPGEDEDKSGLAFVGRAGQLLTKILDAGGIDRDSVFITNVVKCRPPGNRNPQQAEMMKCGDFLEAQLLLLRPSIVVCLGNVPLKWLLKTSQGITKLRGNWIPWRGIELFPMFHPSYLLRDQPNLQRDKYLTWQDVKELGRKFREGEKS